jgi:hypothetical protein
MIRRTGSQQIPQCLAFGADKTRGGTELPSNHTAFAVCDRQFDGKPKLDWCG